ncbi:hypothetical protein R3P38DRAFT_3249110, partial [Favolaschia claudopus]
MGSSSVEAWYTFRAEPLELSTTQDTPLLACHTFLVYALGLGNLILQPHIALLYSIGVSSCTRTSRPCCKRLKLRHSMPTPHILLDETASAPDVSRFHHVSYRLRARRISSSFTFRLEPQRCITHPALCQSQRSERARSPWWNVSLVAVCISLRA